MYRLKIEAVGTTGASSWSKGYLVVPSGGMGKISTVQENSHESPKPSVVIWPQPAVDRIGIQWSNINATQITLRSPTGAVIYTTPTHGVGATALFSTEGLSAGVYFVEILDAAGQHVVDKIMINR